MADVQLEHGHTRIADALYEALIRAPIPGRHKDVVHAIIRLTYGYQHTEREMGSRLIDSVVRIGDRRVRLILVDLERWGVIRRTPNGPGYPLLIRLVKDFEAWRIGHTSRDSRALPPEEIAPGSSRDRPTPGPVPTGPDRPAPPGTDRPAPPGTDARKNLETTLETPGKADGKRRRKTNSPEWLDPQGYARLKQWAEAVVPKTVAPYLDSWIDDALGYYRQEGKRFSDWPQAVLNNIRSRVNRDRKQRGEPPLPTMAKALQSQRRTEKLKAESAARSPPDLEAEDLAAFAKRPEVQALFDA